MKLKPGLRSRVAKIRPTPAKPDETEAWFRSLDAVRPRSGLHQLNQMKLKPGLRSRVAKIRPTPAKPDETEAWFKEPCSQDQAYTS